MLPADTGGKINYSPGTLRPVRKFGSLVSLRRVYPSVDGPRGGVTRPGRFGKPPLDQTAPQPKIHLSPAYVLIRIATGENGRGDEFRRSRTCGGS
jgi:hypothetical protein